MSSIRDGSDSFANGLSAWILEMSLIFCEYCCNISAVIASYLAPSPGVAVEDTDLTIGVSSNEKKTVKTSFGDSSLNGLWICGVSNEHRTSSAIQHLSCDRWSFVPPPNPRKHQWEV